MRIGFLVFDGYFFSFFSIGQRVLLHWWELFNVLMTNAYFFIVLILLNTGG